MLQSIFNQLYEQYYALYFIVQFSASFALVQPTSSLYIILLQFFVDCMVWHLYESTLIDKQYIVIIVSVFWIMIVVIVLYNQ